MDLREAYRIKQYGYQRAEEDRVRRLRALTHEEWLHGLKIVHTVREPDQYLFRAAVKIQRALRDEELSFCFIGGLALQHWGEIRFTKDIDVTILCDPGQELTTLEKLRQIIPPRIGDAEQLALQGRMYLGISPDNIEIDISLGYIPYERRLMERAVDVDFGVGEPLLCCSAEDLVVLKTIAGRDRDWGDLIRIVQRSGRHMDWKLVFSELKPLLDLVGSPESLKRLREMVESEM